jgi:hypothetical protein
MALLMKLFSLLFLILELIMIFWEIKKNYDMSKLRMGRRKLTEEERRTKYAKRMSYIAFVSMILFIVVLLLGSVSNKSRSCPEGKALEAAVCVECQDSNCLSCEKGSKTCS